MKHEFAYVGEKKDKIDEKMMAFEKKKMEGGECRQLPYTMMTANSNECSQFHRVIIG